MPGFPLNSRKLCWLLVGAGVAASPLSAEASKASLSDDLRIYGGKPAKTCEWPTSVGLGGCTGTLVHPRIMLSAAHCSTPRKVQFGEAYRKSIVKTVTPEWCAKNPKFKSREGDFAFCYLKEAVTDVPIAPIAYGCEVEQVKEGAKIWLVGFGSREDGGSGSKYKVEIPINKVMTDGQEIEVGGDGKASCYGDSGGPAFMKMSDGSWRTVGIVSRGTNQKCGYPSVLTTAHSAVPWIQKKLKEKGVTDVDIAPCYDDDGKWAPTDECTGFALDPGTAKGSWDNMCSGMGAKSGKSTICAPEGEKDKKDDENNNKDDDKNEGGEKDDKNNDKDDENNDEDDDKPKSEDSDDTGSDDKSDGGDTGEDTSGDSEEEDDDGEDDDSQPSNEDNAAESSEPEDDAEASIKSSGKKKSSGCSMSEPKNGAVLFGVAGIFSLLALGRRRR